MHAVDTKYQCCVCVCVW